MYLWGLCLRMSFSFGKSLQSRYFKFSIGFLHLAQRPVWAAPLLRRSSVLPKAKPRRRANSLRPSNLKNPRYPKKKHLLCRCFFFVKSLQSRYFKFSIGFLHLAQRPFWAAPLLRRSSVLPKAKPRRRANSLRPSNLKNPRYPKKKHLLCRCFFFGIPRQFGYFKLSHKQAELHPTGLLAGAAFAAYKCFRRRRKPWRRDGFAIPSIQIPEGGGGRNPKL